MFNRGRMTHNFKFKTVAGTLRKEHYPIRGITKALKRKKIGHATKKYVINLVVRSSRTRKKMDEVAYDG